MILVKAIGKRLRMFRGVFKVTKDLMLTYRRTDTLEVVCFSDSNYAGYMDYKNSTSGYIFMMAVGVLSWKSVKQTLIASSTMEAGYVACYEATCHAIWFHNFILT